MSFECTEIHEHAVHLPFGPKNPEPKTSGDIAKHRERIEKRDPNAVKFWSTVHLHACADGPDGTLVPGKRGEIKIEYPLAADAVPFEVGQFYGFSFTKTVAPEHVRIARARRQNEEAEAKRQAAPVDTGGGASA